MSKSMYHWAALFKDLVPINIIRVYNYCMHAQGRILIFSVLVKEMIWLETRKVLYIRTRTCGLSSRHKIKSGYTRKKRDSTIDIYLCVYSKKWYYINYFAFWLAHNNATLFLFHRFPQCMWHRGSVLLGFFFLTSRFSFCPHLDWYKYILYYVV